MDAERIISLSEPDGCFAEIVRLVDTYGAAVVALDNKPRYLVMELGKAGDTIDAPDEDVLAISRRLMKRNRAVYQELAK